MPNTREATQNPKTTYADAKGKKKGTCACPIASEPMHATHLGPQMAAQSENENENENENQPYRGTNNNGPE